MLEACAYPAGIVPRFDVIDRRGAERPRDDKVVEQLFADAERTIKLRAEEEAAQALVIQGRSNDARFAPGQVFELEKHFNASGKYLLTRVEHHATQEGTYATPGEKVA